MNLIERYHQSIMTALFTAGLFYAFFGSLMVDCLNEAGCLLYGKFFIYCFLVQNLRSNHRAFLVLLLLSAFFSLISFSLGLSVLTGMIIYAFLALVCMKMNDLEPIDCIKMTLLPLLLSLFLFIFFEEQAQAISINYFSMLLQAIIFCAYTNINTGFFAHQQDIKNNLLFNFSFIILACLVYCLRQILYLAATAIVSCVLSILSFIASCFVSLFSGLFMILGSIMYSLLSLIPMEINNNHPSTSTTPSAPPDQLDEIFNDFQGLSLPENFWNLLGLLMIVAGLFIILQLVVKLIKKQPVHSLPQEEHREWVNPQDKKRFSFFRKRETLLSGPRKKYRALVNELIKQDYPYHKSMTPLEYLKTIPEDLVQEKGFDSCTEEYLVARYRNNE